MPRAPTSTHASAEKASRTPASAPSSSATAPTHTPSSSSAGPTPTAAASSTSTAGRVHKPCPGQPGRPHKPRTHITEAQRARMEARGVTAEVLAAQAQALPPPLPTRKRGAPKDANTRAPPKKAAKSDAPLSDRQSVSPPAARLDASLSDHERASLEWTIRTYPKIVAHIKRCGLPGHQIQVGVRVETWEEAVAASAPTWSTGGFTIPLGLLAQRLNNNGNPIKRRTFTRKVDALVFSYNHCRAQNGVTSGPSDSTLFDIEILTEKLGKRLSIAEPVGNEDDSEEDGGGWR